MPIAPENRWLYPIDWRELSRLIRFGRAQGRCERCARPHRRDVVHLGDGTWWDEERGAWRDGRGRRVRGLPAPEAIVAAQPWLLGLGAGARPGPPTDPGPEEGSSREEPASQDLAPTPSPPELRPSAGLLVTRVVLASAHLDHDPGNNRSRNLAALCQRCHMLHDAPEHRRTRWRKRVGPRAAGDLFGAEARSDNRTGVRANGRA